MPTARYFSIVYNVANASGIVFSIEDAFKGANCKDFDKLVGMNIDDASMNLGTHKGVSMFLKEKRPSDTVIDCIWPSCWTCFGRCFQNSFI